MNDSSIYKVYVTVQGLIPVNGIRESLRYLCCEEEVKDSDKRYLAWLIGYSNKKEYRKKSVFYQTMFDNYKDLEKFLPIIHVCASHDFLEEHENVARYSQITDSSIWNYFIKAQVQNNRLIKPELMLKNVIDAIRLNYDRDKYNLMVAREYANLHYRLVKESRLEGDDHAEHVSPFLFHSEQKMQTKVNELKQSVVKNQYNWKVLLLDDCAYNDRMETWPKDAINTKNKWHLFNNNKLSIILDQLEECGFNCQWAIYSSEQPNSPNLEKGKNLLIFCTHTINEAEEILKKEKFDIILLDYKLKGEYSYKLLKNISNSEELKKNAGIAEKYFFMYISAYSTAVSERLLAESLNRSEKYWYIGEGACPTNTPELFKYHLLHLMERRLDQTGINDLSEEQIINDVKYIFMPKESSEDWIKAVRKRAYESYHKILGYHYDYFILRENDRNSLLVDSFLRDKVHMNAMLEHLLQLVHLTAFGTVRQWPEIWEEYKFFSRTLTNTNRDSISDVFDSIEKYIIELKSA